MDNTKNYKRRYKIFLILFIVAVVISMVLSYFAFRTSIGKVIDFICAYSSEITGEGKIIFSDTLIIKVPDNTPFSYNMLDDEQPEELKELGYDWFDDINTYSLNKLKDHMKKNEYQILPGTYVLQNRSTPDALISVFSMVNIRYYDDMGISVEDPVPIAYDW